MSMRSRFRTAIISLQPVSITICAADIGGGMEFAMGTYTMLEKNKKEEARSRKEIRQKAASGVSNSALASMMGGGAFKPLSAKLREKFEPGFSANFENIRISRGHIPDEMGLEAVARGTDILVDSRAGDDVIGHELAHTVQQAHGRVPRGGYPVVENAALEHEADELGARAAAGALAAASGDYATIPAMSGATAPAQCKSKQDKEEAKRAKWRKNRTKEMHQGQEYAFDQMSANTENMNAVLEAGEAQGILDDVDADSSMKSRNFNDAAARYNLTQQDPGKQAKKDGTDTRRQRFLQRHLTGTQEQQDQMMREVMEEGDVAMNRYLAQDAQRVLAYRDRSIKGTDDHAGLLKHGAHALKLTKDVQNMSDMIKDGRSTAESLGLTPEQMDTLKAKIKHLLGDQSVAALRGLQSMAAAGTPEAQEPGKKNWLDSLIVKHPLPVKKKKGFLSRMFGR